MRVLLVAPTSDLEYVPSEVQDILDSGLTVRALLDDLSQADFHRAAKSRSDWDALFLLMHGGPTGFPFRDGLLSPSGLVQLVRGRFPLIYLNTCESMDTAQMIQNEGEATVVATIREVEDAEAYRTGSKFAQALAETGDSWLAYKNSLPGNNRTYLYLSSGQKKE